MATYFIENVDFKAEYLYKLKSKTFEVAYVITTKMAKEKLNEK